MSIDYSVPTGAQALKCIRHLGDLNIVGMDLVEMAPSYDQSEITALAAPTSPVTGCA